ncbi:MAG: HisA/HisF family protein [archaeon]|nr:HisA/HisF family protein [archaeon]
MLTKVPVLDLKNGIAVSGKSGFRDTYTPLQSIYGSSSNLIEIATNLKLNSANEIYIADLDLIESVGHNIDKIQMVNTVLPVIFDGGVKNFESFKFFIQYAYKIIVATETLESIDELRKIFDTFPKERIVVSVDIKDNELLNNNLNMCLKDFKEVLREFDPNEIILLDVSSVGTNNGTNYKLFNEFEEFRDKLILGGGINSESIKELPSLGIKKVLIGTSLHNGEITIL